MIQPNPKRTCDSCSVCCEGWIFGEAHGHKFYEGKPCFFLQKNCTIYPNRPKDPCVDFKCAWLGEEFLPMWMRPDLSKVLVIRRSKNNINYYDVIETGENIQSHILNWIIQWALRTENNILYRIKGSLNKIGSRDFIELDTVSK